MINRDAKIFNKKLAIHIQQLLKRSYTMIKWNSSQGCKDFFQHPQINQCDIPYQQNEE